MTIKLPTQKSHSSAPQPTFLDHLHELRSRLFWTVGFIIVASGAAFSLKEHIIFMLMAPLGNQALYYLTPAGGFSFILKICTYTGVLFAVPFILYNVYRFLEPLMGQRRHSVVGFVVSSILLACIGVVFAYLVSLPAALHFLTHLQIGHIQAMLTADAYLSFVATYLLGAAILFQIPLVLLITNSIWPLPPKRLLHAQRYVIVAAFIIAAIISPTPDIMNQALLALPVIGMFEVGVGCVWVQNAIARRQKQYPGIVVPQATRKAPPNVSPPAIRPVRVLHDIVPGASVRPLKKAYLKGGQSMTNLRGSSLASPARPRARSFGRGSQP